MSREQAERRFISIERKLKNNAILRDRYVNFMLEYEDINHMTVDQINRNQPSVETIEYYMPHHGVLREASTTTNYSIAFQKACLRDFGGHCKNVSSNIS